MWSTNIELITQQLRRRRRRGAGAAGAAGPRTIDLYGYFYRRQEIDRAAPVRPPFTPNYAEPLTRTIDGKF